MPSPNKEENITWYEQKYPFYKKFTLEIKNVISKLLEKHDVNFAILEGRAKTPDSYKNKLDTIDYEGKKMADLAGIRIVGYVRSDVEEIEKIIRENFEVDEERTKNKSEELDPNQLGYLARHIICSLTEDRKKLPEYSDFPDFFVEIQIKTLLEHTWAAIEHDRNYKYKNPPKSLKRELYLTMGLLEVADQKFDEITTEIDNTEANVFSKTTGNLKDVEVNPFTIKRYLIEKYSKDLRFKPIYGLHPKDGSKEIREIKYFDINNMEDFEKRIKPNLLDLIHSGSIEITNISVLLLVILFLAFNDDYFDIIKETRHFSKEDFERFFVSYKKLE